MAKTADGKSSSNKSSSSNKNSAKQDSVQQTIETDGYQGIERRQGHSEQLAECLGKNLETVATAFAKGSKRAERIVLMWMFAFVLLAAYGFFLIYNLTSDVHRVADQIQEINQSVNRLSTDMSAVRKTMDAQSTYMYEMVYHIRSMNNSMNQIRYDMSIMNNSVSRPMNFMNSFIPW